ncbi:MAG: archaellin/type IV pilin N-terminal domain-containing protein, partial [Candidatus Thermoplasmatota archaeon]|nr:archaellin/type IV pilin N-terminal domain-containing protein [Candidatus Thermoplasmatota archaeon]
MRTARLKKIRFRADKKGEMGIGTMILFIAMVLVAAIAAALLITTASQLNQQAQETGTIAQQEVATSMIMRNIQGDRLIDSQGATQVMPTVDANAPTAATISGVDVMEDDTGTPVAYGYEITIGAASVDSGSGVMMEQIIRSNDPIIGDTDDAVILTTSYLGTTTSSSIHLLTASQVIYDVPPQDSGVADSGAGAGSYWYFIKTYDKAGNSATSYDSTLYSAASITVAQTETTENVILATVTVAAGDIAGTTATVISDISAAYTVDAYIGYALVYTDTETGNVYNFRITDNTATTITVNEDIVDLTTINTAADTWTIVGLDGWDQTRPVAPSLTTTGLFKATSGGPNSGYIELSVSGLDFSITLFDRPASGQTWTTNAPITPETQIRGFNVYRSSNLIGTDAPPNMVPIGFWDIADWTISSDSGSSTWYDYVQQTGGEQKTAYYYAIAAVDLSGNEVNNYHATDKINAGYGLGTSQASAASCTNDEILPIFNVYSVVATQGTYSINIAWTGAANPSDSGSGMAAQDFRGSQAVTYQDTQAYTYEIWRGVEPIFNAEQLPIGGNINPLIKLAGYAKNGETTFEDFGVDWNTKTKYSSQDNMYYYT